MAAVVESATGGVIIVSDAGIGETGVYQKSQELKQTTPLLSQHGKSDTMCTELAYSTVFATCVSVNRCIIASLINQFIIIIITNAIRLDGKSVIKLSQSKIHNRMIASVALYCIIICTL